MSPKKDWSIKLIKNTGSSMIYQIVTIICGFVLPRIILSYYGSGVNGLINSISQFLTTISLLDLGVGEVVRSSLYSPLAKKDTESISRVILSAGKFFKKLAMILIAYVTVLIIVFPKITDIEFDACYVSVLVIAMSASSFAQYYFGMVNSLLLSADQKGYIQYNVQTITLIINTIACSVLIIAGFSIQYVKIVTALIYLFRPAFLQVYVNRHYKINSKVDIKEEPIKQKWNGVAQHMSTVVLNHTDTIVLTLLGTLYEVSIYSVYHMVIYGVKNIFDAMVTGIKPLLGELWVKGNEYELNKTFNYIEWLMHNAVIFFFGCTSTLIVPFVRVYTKGVTDANYVQPIFAYLITCAYAVHCLRLPYNMMILAAGHFKQTQKYYTIAALINIIVSVITVKTFGLNGVSAGTLFAMLFHTIWTAIYNTKYLLKRPLKHYFKQLVTNLLIIFVCIAGVRFYKLKHLSYMGWIILAAKTAMTWGAAQILINYFFYKDNLAKIWNKLLMRDKG